MVDLCFRNAKILTETGFIYGGLTVMDGVIASVGPDVGQVSAEETMDLGGRILAPGLVDLHVHFREPGFTQKEDFASGTAAALAGGVTTVVDEPNNDPVTNSVETLRSKRRLVGGKAYTNYALQMAVYGDKLGEVREAGEIGVKLFAFFDELGGKPTGMEDMKTLEEALRLVKAADGVALLNCRNSGIVNSTISQMKKDERNTLEDYMTHFPHIAESGGARDRIQLAHKTGTRAHLREVSTMETIDVLKSHGKYMENITAEVRPDHLFLNKEDTLPLGPYAQQWTPLRRKKDSDALWMALIHGTIKVIASDHATHTRMEKERGWGNIWESPPGLPAIESMLPLLLTAANKGRISFENVFKYTATTPAKVLGVYPGKGVIREGSDADLVVVDPGKKYVIRGENSKAKTHWTPYEGWRVCGSVEATYVGGVESYRDGEIVGKKGQGRYLKL